MPSSPLPRRLPWFIPLALAALACTTFIRPEPTPAPAIAPTPEPTPRFSRGLVAYLGPDGNLYVFDPEDSAQPVAVTDDAQPQLGAGQEIVLYRYPAWSPDGRFLAFVAIRAGSEGDGTALLVAEPGTATPMDHQEIFFSRSETPFYLYWAPDSASVTFLGSAARSASLLMRQAFLDGRAARLLDTGQPYYWHWSPDSARILVHEGGSRETNPEARLSLLTAEDGESVDFSIPPDQFQAPAWGPDGESFLAVVQQAEAGPALARFSQDGALLDTLLEVDGPAAFSASPDGTRIAVHLKPPGGSVIGSLVVLEAGSGQTVWTRFERDVLAYFWAPDGEQLAFFHLESQGLDALASTQTQEGGALLHLSVVRVSTGSILELARFEPTRDFLELIPFNDQYHHSLTIWAPDSSHLVYTGQDERGEDVVWLVPSDGSAPPKWMFEGSLAIWSWW